MITLEECLKISGELGDDRDCAVRAVAIATQLPYMDVWKTFTKQGRRFRRGARFDDITKPVLRKLGFNPLQIDPPGDAKTVRTLARELADAEGAYLVRVSRHLLCIRDGEVQDWTRDRLHRVNQVYKVIDKRPIGWDLL